MRRVRVTQMPDQVLEVGEAEYLDLKAQGLLVAETAVDKPRQAAAQPAKKEEN